MFGFLIVLLVVAIALLISIDREIFSEKEDKSTVEKPISNLSTSPTNSTLNKTSAPNAPSKCSLAAQNDNYAKPDFDRLENVMSEQGLVKDVPSKGTISLKFFHFTEGCRLWDKSYIISDGKISAKDSEADIYIILSSNYVDRINEGNFCDIIKEARENGDLGQWTADGISETTLLWRYKGMLKYADCLGIKI